MAEAGKGHRQRLKERFLANEARAHSDEALLELLLTYAIPQKDVLPIARRLLTTFGSLRQVLTADIADLGAVEGIGDHAVALLRLIAWIAQTHFAVSPLSPAGVQVLPETPRRTGEVQSPDLSLRSSVDGEPRWRATGPYTASIASKTGLVEETRLALRAYAQLQDATAVRQHLLDGGLPQRSRATREGIVRALQDRLSAWDPPRWVCEDLVTAATGTAEHDLQLLLLLHSARQDRLLYDLTQQVLTPRWREGVVTIARVDVQRFLDMAVSVHPEIDGWSSATREKLAGNLLTILRDDGLLQGGAIKRMVEPVVSPRAARHLERLLHEEGVPERDLPHHPDWNLWLLDPPRARALLEQARRGEDAR